MTSEKALLVGMAPVPGSPGEREGLAFVDTASGERLARLILGLGSSRDLPDYFDLVNVVVDPEWSQAKADAAAPRMITQFIAGRYSDVVLLGAGPAQAFGVPYHPHYAWRNMHTELQAHSLGMRARRWKWRVAVMPHPSGTVLHWNSPENRAEGRRFLEGLAPALIGRGEVAADVEPTAGAPSAVADPLEVAPG